MKKMICFDLDGTLADLYSVENWLAKLHNENPEPYEVAKPLVNILELNTILNTLVARGWEIRVISWLAKDSTEHYKEMVRKAKLEWLARYEIPYSKAHLIAYGTTKANCVRKVADMAILVDDNEQVRKGWTLGPTINAKAAGWLEALKSLQAKAKP